MGPTIIEGKWPRNMVDVTCSLNMMSYSCSECWREGEGEGGIAVLKQGRQTYGRIHVVVVACELQKRNLVAY